MKVPLSTFCPVCKSKSQPNRLNRELGAEEVFCVNPATQKPLHTFPSLENAEAYDPSLAFLEAQGEEQEEAPAPTPKPKPAPRVAAPKAKAAELDPVPAAVEEKRLTPNEAVDEVTEMLHEFAVEEKPAIPSLFNAEKPAKPVKFTPPPARKASGGVLILTVRIPDQHVSFLTAEAESQKQTVEQYFQEAVERGCESRWFF